MFHLLLGTYHNDTKESQCGKVQQIKIQETLILILSVTSNNEKIHVYIFTTIKAYPHILYHLLSTSSEAGIPIIISLEIFWLCL
jgi:hypothetical protein